MAEENQKIATKKIYDLSVQYSDAETLSNEDTEEMEKIVNQFLNLYEIQVNDLNISNTKIKANDTNLILFGEITYNTINDSKSIPQKAEMYSNIDISNNSYHLVTNKEDVCYEILSTKIQNNGSNNTYELVTISSINGVNAKR
ncbi:hypothetical protein [Methanolapillus ohkumae]|uniref:Uncharacterized protein n=1 Tax=Methanolapillus ohkumae TaxID=3028298 RepID=A0AA96V8B7_9EURY|nr:hypothetical protein MsAm2_15070 [Methanosarcinaceae archaeon Am2]